MSIFILLNSILHNVLLKYIGKKIVYFRKQEYVYEWSCNFKLQVGNLEGVGPVDNRPSTD